MAKIALLLLLQLFGPASAVHQKDHTRQHLSATVGLRQRLQALVAQRHGTTPATDTVQTVQTLTEVVNGITEEEDKNMARKASLHTSCRNTDNALEAAIKESERTATSASEDLQAVNAQTVDMQAAIASLNQEITGSSAELDTLQARLKQLREENAAVTFIGEGTLLAVDQAAGQAKRVAHQQHRMKVAPSPLTKQVSYLEELSNSLTASALPAPSFMQMASKGQSVAAVDALKADKDALLQSRETARDDFNEDEKNTLELIAIERKKLADLEKSLEDQQPTLARKLQQSAELTQTVTSSNRGLVRDRAVLETSQSKCTTMFNSIETQKGIRLQISDKIRMAVKLLETMDASVFLSKDVTSLEGPPSFLQVKSRSVGPMDIQNALLDSMSSAGPAPAGGQAAVLGLLAEASSSEATSAIGEQGQVSGPFDQVTDMIKALISSLKEQANGAVNKDQFCQDSIGQNRVERLQKKTTIDTKKSEMRAAGTAMNTADVDIEFLTNELTRLNALVTTATEELQGEQDRITQEAEDHRLAVNIVNEVMSVLTQLCELDTFVQTGAGDGTDGGAAFLQMDAKKSLSKSGAGTASTAKFMTKSLSKFSQCGEAVTLLTEGVTVFGQQDTAAQAYLTGFETISAAEKSDAEAAVAERTTDKTQKECSRAAQADAKATAEGDLQSAQTELTLIEEAKTQLEKDCGPGTETHEERHARRQEEIEALKSAYDVLDGEAVPV